MIWRYRETGWRVIVVVAALCAVGLACAPGASALGGAPVIVSMGSRIGGEVEVEATINPRGLATTYEILVECSEDCGLAPSATQKTGALEAGDEPQRVSLNITGIKSGAYRYWVFARNADGESYGRAEIEVREPPPAPAPLGPPENPAQPYEPGPYESILPHEEAIARKNAEEAKAANEARQRAREASLRAAEAVAREQKEEEAAALQRKLAAACVVPRLHGDTVHAARRALRRAQCSLGRVHGPRHLGTAKVVRQSQRPGTRLPAGSEIALTLRPSRR